MGNRYSRNGDPAMLISSPHMLEDQGCISIKRWQSINLKGLEEARRPHDNSQTYDLSIRNLTYKVRVKEKEGKTEEKILLNNISARANHGEILAVAGPSGSSKSTLLNALAGRIDRKSLRGSILVNGNPVDKNFKRISGYVIQDDALYPLLTVRETLLFSARLRLPSTWTHDQRMARVEVILAELGLQLCADTMIGDETVRGVSRGEKRRVSIAVDLMHDPAVLLLDKPTTGLDSFSAYQVMQKLHTLAEIHSRTVIITINQPSYDILELIHNTLLLIDGNVIFSGHHSALVNYFSDIGYNMPEYVNPLEYALETMQKVKASSVGVQQLLELKVVKEKEKVLDGQAARELDEEGTEGEVDEMTFATSFRSETYVLGERNITLMLRSRPLFFARMAVLMLGGLFTSSVFINSEYDLEGMKKRQSMIAFLLAYCIFTTAYALHLLLQERAIFIREASRGAYRPASFVISQTIVQIPFLFLHAVFLTLSTYFIAGWANYVGAISYYIWMWFLVLTLAQSMASCCAGWIPNIIICQAVFSAVTSFFFLFSGFFIRRNAIPKGWLWLHYLSIFKYPQEGLLVNEITSLWNTNWAGADTNINFYQVLELNDLQHVSLITNVLVMTFFIVVYRGLWYLAFLKSARGIQKVM